MKNSWNLIVIDLKLCIATATHNIKLRKNNHIKMYANIANSIIISDSNVLVSMTNKMADYGHICDWHSNSLTAKLFNLNFHPLKVVSR